MARGYRERGQLIEARELLAPLVADGRTDLAGVLADVLADLGLTDDAEHAYRVAIALDDGEAMNNFALFCRPGPSGGGGGHVRARHRGR